MSCRMLNSRRKDDYGTSIMMIVMVHVGLVDADVGINLSMKDLASAIYFQGVLRLNLWMRALKRNSDNL